MTSAPPLRRLMTVLSVVAALSFSLVQVVRPAMAVQGEVFLASSTSTGVVGNASSYYGGELSGDGSVVAFESQATNLHPDDTDSVPDIYVKDLRSGAVHLASSRADGLKGNGLSRDPTVSADGTKVAFATFSTNLDPRDVDEHGDLYLKDLVTGELTLVSTNAEENKWYAEGGDPSLSADGRKVSFFSTGGLAPGSAGAGWAIYVKDLVTGHVVFASVGPDGRPAEAPAAGPISGDGSRVVFSTQTTLLAADGDNEFDPADNRFDVYVKDLTTGELLLADTTASGEKANADAFGDSLSWDGTKVAFTTRATNLDPRNPAGTENVYVKDLASGALRLAGISEARGRP